MNILPSREIHLDFHTSPLIPGVGSRFNRKEFQETLLTANVNSITIFAKCHHGYCYYPTEVTKQHPGMEEGRDLTGEMIDACHEVGIRAPVYIPIGWSALDAEEHPEWIMKNRDGSYIGAHVDPNADRNDPRPEVSWYNMCSAGGYRDHLCRLTEEICQRYKDLDGLFFDIVFNRNRCWCSSCLKGMRENGFDPDSDDDVLRYYEQQKEITLNMLRDILFRYHPDATIFFNTGGADILKPQWHRFSTHFEMEDLPTRWGGYDKMPMRAKYFSKKGEFLGMTGKFHCAWGEFGGFKSKEALRYECASLLAYGAKISIGDQLHPDGHMDSSTYELIGSAYSYVKSVEQFCYDTKDQSRVTVMISDNAHVNEGITKLLLDMHVDFDVITEPKDIDRAEFIIVPDRVSFDSRTAEAINGFLKRGGKLLLTGGAGLAENGDGFGFDTELKYMGRSGYDCDYVTMGENFHGDIPRTPVLFYSSTHLAENGDEILASAVAPYFSRTYGHYCSHANTPYPADGKQIPCCIRFGNITYVGHEICTIYADYGAVVHRKYMENILRMAGFRNNVRTNLQSCGRIRLTEQPQENRYVLHLLYAIPITRGKVSVIDDQIKVDETEVEIDTDRIITCVRKQPGGEIIPFTQDEGTVRFTVDSFISNQIITLDYEA